MEHDSVTLGAEGSERDPRTVFVVHGRDEALRRGVGAWLLI